MTTFVFVNNVNTTLAAAITSTTATTMTLSDVSQLPTSIAAGSSIAFVLRDAATRLSYEVVYATAISGSTLTIVRGREGSTAQTWASGDFAFSGVTSGQMASFGGGGVTSFNTRTGAITLTSSDVTTALTYTPYPNTGGGISGSVQVTGTVLAGSTYYTNGTSAILACGPASTGVAGTVYLRPGGYSSSTGQTTVSSAGLLTVANGLTVTAGNITSNSAVVSGANFTSSSTAVNLNATGSGSVNLRPNGQGVTTGQLTVASSGAVTINGTLTTTGTVNFNTSDRRLKKNIKRIHARPVHRHVPYVSYDRRDIEASGRGNTAQSVQRFDPSYVSEYDHPAGKRTVKRLAVDHVGLAYEQSMWAGAEIDRQAVLIDKLTKRIERLERK